MEKENQQTLADEIDRIKIETDQEKNELKVSVFFYKKLVSHSINRNQEFITCTYGCELP